MQLENRQTGSEDCDAPSSNGDDSDDDDNVRQSPNEEDEAQDSPGPTITAANFDPDVSTLAAEKYCTPM